MTEGVHVPPMSDDEMRAALAGVQPYTIVILRKTPAYAETPEVGAVIWEHGRRNFELRARGELAIVCPVGDSEVAGIGIFTTDGDATHRIMDADPAVTAGYLSYETYATRSFPGDALPSLA
jgi:hypothetical protein